jgi:hypothetical protein
VVLAGVGVGEGVPLTVGSGLDAGDVAVIVGVGEADTVADGLPDEVAVGLALVDVDGLDEHALSSVAAQRPTPSHTSRRGRHSGLLRPAQPIAFLLWCVALRVSLTLPHRTEFHKSRNSFSEGPGAAMTLLKKSPSVHMPLGPDAGRRSLRGSRYGRRQPLDLEVSR